MYRIASPATPGPEINPSRCAKWDKERQHTLAVAQLSNGARPIYRIRLFDIATGTLGGTITSRTQVNAIVFSPDGRQIAGGCGFASGANVKNPGYIKVWALPRPE
jgi:hypothetical protein